MRAITKKWFEVGVKYERTSHDGRQRYVRETVVVSAMLFGHAEAQATEYMEPQCSGEMSVTSVAIAPYMEIFFSDKSEDDRWFKAKLAFITLDMKTDKEKKTAATYLVQGKDIPTAVKGIDEVMAPTMIDYYIVSLNETAIVEVRE